MQMHYRERKYTFKNYMKNCYKSQIYKGSNRLSKLQKYLPEKKRTMKIQTNFKHSVNVALKIDK